MLYLSSQQGGSDLGSSETEYIYCISADRKHFFLCVLYLCCPGSLIWHNAVNTDAVARTKHFLYLVFGFVHILTPVQTCCCLVLVLGHMLMLALHVWTILKGWLISVHKLSNFEEYFVLISKCFESPWSLVGWFFSREWSLGTPWTAPNVKLSC